MGYRLRGNDDGIRKSDFFNTLECREVDNTLPGIAQQKPRDQLSDDCLFANEVDHLFWIVLACGWELLAFHHLAHTLLGLGRHGEDRLDGAFGIYEQNNF